MTRGAAALDLLPDAWRADRFLLAQAARWRDAEVVGDADGVLALVGSHDAPPHLVGRGSPTRVRTLLDDLVTRRAGLVVRWASLPRGTDPDASVLAQLGLVRVSQWDWFSTDPDGRAASGPPPGPGAVVPLDPARDADAIRACLRSSNPTSSADPAGDHEAAWFGVRDEDALLGVIGAAREPGRDARGFSWHLHGLGVVTDARRRGLGSALTVAATDAGLARGADWVSLGMYADNDAARRIYERLGFTAEARLESFGPVSEDRPPA